MYNERIWFDLNLTKLVQNWEGPYPTDPVSYAYAAKRGISHVTHVPDLLNVGQNADTSNELNYTHSYNHSLAQWCPTFFKPRATPKISKKSRATSKIWATLAFAVRVMILCSSAYVAKDFGEFDKWNLFSFHSNISWISNKFVKVSRILNYRSCLMSINSSVRWATTIIICNWAPHVQILGQKSEVRSQAWTVV